MKLLAARAQRVILFERFSAETIGRRWDKPPWEGVGGQLEERAGGCEMGAVEEPETDSRFSIHSFSQSLSVSPEEECCVRPWGREH